jgi:ribose transport system permease protein
MRPPYAITGAEMDGMTAAILGGVSFFGGGSSGMGVVLIGLLLLQVFQNGLVTINLNSYWQIVSRGGLLILALIVDYYREKRRIAMLKAGVSEAEA